MINMSSIDVVIETPKGSTEKYAYVPNTPFFELKKILPSGMVFPYDFGFIPKTQGEDGDPLDIIVISEFNSFPCIIISCRVIGAILAEQSREEGDKEMIRNDRVIAIPKCSNIFDKVEDVNDLPRQLIKELEAFFVEYNKLEGKKFTVVDIAGASEAKKIVKKATGED
jgi:inorganic pyrophosphatase